MEIMDCVLFLAQNVFPPRSVGVANFNASHLTELMKARPDNVPVGG